MIAKEGSGWRLAWDPSRDSFPYLIGGEGWALELTKDEWNSLFSIISDLIAQHQKLENQLMPQESLCLELERDSWWGCLDGDKFSWSLQLALPGGAARGGEVSWPAQIAKAFVHEMRTVWDSSQ